MDKQAGRTQDDVTFAIIVEFELADGVFDAFYRLVSENASLSVELEPGCLRFDVLVPLDNASSSVLLYEIYTSREDFTEHLTMPHYLAFDQATRPMVRAKTVTNFGLSQHAKGLVAA